MKTPGWANDDDILQAMIVDALKPDESALAPAPVDDHMVRAAKAAFTWRTVDQELERLTMAAQTQVDAVLRTWRNARLVEFRGESLSIELEIDEQSIIGQVYPAGSGLITFIPATGSDVDATIDELGCFTINRVVDGPFRLRCVTTDGSVVTEWMT